MVIVVNISPVRVQYYDALKLIMMEPDAPHRLSIRPPRFTNITKSIRLPSIELMPKCFISKLFYLSLVYVNYNFCTKNLHIEILVKLTLVLLQEWK